MSNLQKYLGLLLVVLVAASALTAASRLQQTPRNRSGATQAQVAANTLDGTVISLMPGQAVSTVATVVLYQPSGKLLKSKEVIVPAQGGKLMLSSEDPCPVDTATDFYLCPVPKALLGSLTVVPKDPNQEINATTLNGRLFGYSGIRRTLAVTNSCLSNISWDPNSTPTFVGITNPNLRETLEASLQYKLANGSSVGNPIKVSVGPRGTNYRRAEQDVSLTAFPAGTGQLCINSTNSTKFVVARTHDTTLANQVCKETPLITNADHQGDPELDGDYLIWRNETGSRIEVFAYNFAQPVENGTNLTPVSQFPGFNREPQISGNLVIWEYDPIPGTRSLLYIHNLSTQQSRLAANGNPYQSSSVLGTLLAPQINSDLALWVSNNGSFRNSYLAYSPISNLAPDAGAVTVPKYGVLYQNQIYAYERIGVETKITRYPYPNGPEVLVATVPGAIQSMKVELPLIVYSTSSTETQGKYLIRAFNLDTGTTTTVTESAMYDQFDLSGNTLVWPEGSSTGDLYGYVYPDGPAKRLTSDPADQLAPSLSGNRLVWNDNRSGNRDLYYCDLNLSVDTPTPTPIMVPTSQPTIPPTITSSVVSPSPGAFCKGLNDCTSGLVCDAQGQGALGRCAVPAGTYSSCNGGSAVGLSSCPATNNQPNAGIYAVWGAPCSPIGATKTCVYSDCRSGGAPSECNTSGSTSGVVGWSCTCV